MKKLVSLCVVAFSLALVPTVSTHAAPTPDAKTSSIQLTVGQSYTLSSGTPVYDVSVRASGLAPSSSLQDVLQFSDGSVEPPYTFGTANNGGRYRGTITLRCKSNMPIGSPYHVGGTGSATSVTGGQLQASWTAADC